MEDEIPRGQFIQHIDFENQDISELLNEGDLQYVYEIDHDFVSMKKQLIARKDFYE